MAVYDFHTHTFLSDGVLSPVELIRRAAVRDYTAIAVTDHAALGTLERIIRELTVECALAQDRWGIIALPGVELTHVPVSAIGEAAQRAKGLGARLVIVHGETVVEPVEPGTNLAAVQCPYVDILAHPGLLTVQVAALAAQNNVLIEVSARRGHSLANGHVVRTARQEGAIMVVDSDAHAPEDLLTAEYARMVARGAGLDEGELEGVLSINPQALLRRLGAETSG